MTPPDTSDEQHLSGAESLRRIEAMAVAYGAAGAIAAAFFWGPRQALALTAGAAASIVAFRGLQGFVEALLPPENRPHQRRAWRAFLRQLLRFFVLGGGLGLAYFLGSGNYLIVIAGVSVLPAALLTEGALETARALRGG